MLPASPVALDQDDLRNQMKAAATHKECPNCRLAFHCLPHESLIPILASQLVTTEDALYCVRSLHLSVAQSHHSLSAKHSSSQRLDLLRCFEAPSGFLKLLSSQPLALPLDCRACQPASHVPLHSQNCRFTAPDCFILKLPPQSAKVSTPTSLNLHSTPELIFTADCIAPHPQSNNVATHIPLQSDDLSSVTHKLLSQLAISFATQVAHPKLPDCCCSCMHHCQSHLSLLLNKLDGHKFPVMSLDFHCCRSHHYVFPCCCPPSSDMLSVLTAAEDTLDHGGCIIASLFHEVLLSIRFHVRAAVPAVDEALDQRRRLLNRLSPCLHQLLCLPGSRSALHDHCCMHSFPHTATRDHADGKALDDTSGSVTLLFEPHEPSSHLRLDGCSSLVVFPRADLKSSPSCLYPCCACMLSLCSVSVANALPEQTPPKLLNLLCRALSEKL
mmetsp:Transcript_52104/g.93378  ORF Transcript_52104/g.93378 Transcript_52104/m.93378 type:complete len:442 (-) Transcript_52104:1382-2707(-)